MNKTLKYLDLDSNKLNEATSTAIVPVTSSKDKDKDKDKDREPVAAKPPGMDGIIRVLAQNKSLISLHLANNNLNDEVGRKFDNMFEEN